MILLSRNSRVDAYRNEQLLGSFYLNSGSQFIDTSSFPPGSYSVALKVYENNQLTRTELVPFTKTGGLTDGNAQWFLQAGKTTSQVSDDESSAYQLGVRLPLHPQYELYAGLANADDVSAFELGNNWTADLGEAGNLAISASVFRNDDGGKGDMQQANWSHPGWPTLGFYRTNSDGDACTTDNRESYNALSCYESISATVSQNLVGWNMMLGYTRTQNNTDDSLRWDKQQSFENNYLRQTSAQSISETVQLSASRAFVMRDWILSTSLGFSIVMTTAVVAMTTVYICRFRYLIRRRWTAITTAIQPMFLLIIVIAIRMAIKRHGSYRIPFITTHSAIKSLA